MDNSATKTLTAKTSHSIALDTDAFVTFATFRNTLKKLCEFLLVGKIPVESQACRASGLLYLYQPLFILSLEEILKAIITDSTHPPSKPILSTKGTRPASWPTLYICPWDTHMCRQSWCVISCTMSCLLTHSHCKASSTTYTEVSCATAWHSPALKDKKDGKTAGRVGKYL